MILYLAARYYTPLSLCPTLPSPKQMPHMGQIPLSVGIAEVGQ